MSEYAGVAGAIDLSYGLLAARGEELVESEPPEPEVPEAAHYRQAADPHVSCGTCAYYDSDEGVCMMFADAPVLPMMVCDEWETAQGGAGPRSQARPEDAYAVLTPDDVRALATASEALEPAHPVSLRKALQPVKAAGIAVRAADTGRVLMIQRSLDAADRAKGTWEFPGGKLNDGEHPFIGARREWQEETGMRLPRGQHVGEWRSGVYRGFVHEVPSEASVKLNLDPEDRRVLNPDDPDGDQIEVIAWHAPEHLRYMRSLRSELRRSKVWAKVEKAAPLELSLRVGGVTRAASGASVYRLHTSDDVYVGTTQATGQGARKGDVLKVQVHDLLQDAQGDPRFVDARVVTGYVDAPHSWAELQALAGAHVEKDTAPGPGGDIPPAGDEGIDANPPSRATLLATGPTADSVHVNVPLPNISQAYVGRRRGKAQPVLRGEFLPITKADRMKQLVYGVVLEPNSLDSQDDFMLPHHVERTAHNYLKKAIRGRSSVAKLQHRAQGFFKTKPSICPVESFIAPVDFTYDGVEVIKKGSWVLCMHVEDPALWQDFLDGKYQAFSVGGTGVRQSFSSASELSEHDLIGREQPNYFEPDPRRALSPPFG